MKNQDSPAFGHSVPGDEKAGWLPEAFPGISKAEYFAGQALVGMLSNPTITDIISGNNGLPVPSWVSEVSKEIGIATAQEFEVPAVSPTKSKWIELKGLPNEIKEDGYIWTLDNLGEVTLFGPGEYIQVGKYSHYQVVEVPSPDTN